jgi:hypothetical protein
MTITYLNRPIEELWEEWTTGPIPPRRPTAAECEARPGLLHHWMEATWDRACLDVFKELRKEEKGEKP